MGEKVTFAFTTNALSREVVNALEVAERVQKALHEDATQAERDKIAELVADLRKVNIAAAGVECPNPFFSYFTVDKDKLTGY